MNVKSWMSCLLLIVGMAAGCERPADSPPAPAPAPPAAEPALPVETAPEPRTSAAPAVPALSFLMIDGQLFEFPRARLRLKNQDDQVAVLLFSDDPAHANNDAYTGNSYYLDMRLDIDDPVDFNDQIWPYKASSSERAESPNGVFLDGWTRHLQPFDIVVEFEKHEKLATVWIAGRFMMFHTRDRNVPPQLVPVSGRLTVNPEIR
jgi:hypothetical protein